MALVGEIVARFRAENSEFLQKVDQVKQKNVDLAKSFVAAAGSADAAMTTIKSAKQLGKLGELGLDPRQVSGLNAAIRAQAKGQSDAIKDLADQAKRARGAHDIFESLDHLQNGDWLTALRQIKTGLKDLQETAGKGGGQLFNIGLTAAALDFGGKKLAELTQKAIELREQWRAGKVTAGEMTEKLLGQVPIYGGIWQTGRNIRELLGLENDELGHTLSLLGRINESRQQSVEVSKQLRASAEAFTGQMKNWQAEIQALKLEFAGLGKQASAVRIKAAAVDELDNFRKQQQAGADKLIKAVQDSMNAEGPNGKLSLNDEFTTIAQKKADLKQEIDELNKQISEIGNGPYSGTSRATADVKLLQLKDELAEVTEQYDKLDQLRRRKLQDVSNIQSQVDSQVEQRQKSIDDRTSLQLKNLFKGDTWIAQARAAANSFVDIWRDGFKTITDYVQQQREKAKSIHDSLKTQGERMMDQVNEAMDLFKNGYLSKTDFGRLLQGDYKKLADDREAMQPQRVFDLPDVKEFRSGQALFAPPTKSLDDQQLKAIQDGNTLLQQIRDVASSNGIVVNEVSY